MADQEIAKHTKKVVRVLSNPEHGWSHKLREMALEIFTIVFAVTLSIWLHGLSEHRHQQEQVKTFLLGLKGDLKRDMVQLRQLKAFYQQSDANFAYLTRLTPELPANPKVFETAYLRADSNYFFIPVTSRYEGFKSSGKLGTIENETLLNHILTLHETLRPQIESSEGGWRTQQGRMRAYLEQELDYPDETMHRYRLIVAPKAKRLLKRMVAQPQLYQRYQNYADMAARIIQAIDRAYPDAAKS